ncbi:hypothetical protein V8J88_04480 [Massilia sp. W12]|uniref:hypothetical protein n=1 Tax=Massilia sp. W12 TaxID=3126507 RepID=UPI0030CE334C
MIKQVLFRTRWQCGLRLGQMIVPLLLFCAPCHAQVSTPNPVFDISNDADFSNHQQVIRQYIQKRQTTKSTQVCLLGKLAADSSKLAWVIWDAGQEIILYEPGETDLKLSRRKLNLKKDVVENEAALHGSTYLVTRDWVTQLRAECKQSGKKLQIEKQRR